MMKTKSQLSIPLTLCIIFAAGSLFAAPLRVENVTRVKGQEVTEIRGYGIVSGLAGTGDDPKAYDPTCQAILRTLERSGMAGATPKGIGTSKNNALVEVTVTIPANGGRDGDRLDCSVASVGNAKSLQGGRLSAAMIAHPLPQDETTPPLGMAWGDVTIENPARPLVGRVKNGCRLIGDFTNPYIKDGNITLVIKQEFSDPRMAMYVTDAINNDVAVNDGRNPGEGGIAKAISPHYVVVRVPKHRFNDPMQFVADLMSAEVNVERPMVPRVTINEQAGIIVIDENVEVKPIVLTQRNIVAEIRPQPAAGEQEENPQQFVDVDTDVKFRQMNGEAVTNNMKLKALQASLDAVRVTPQDMIEIIKSLERQGAIVGEVHFIE
ncbi:flagellar P-ring protein [Planctomycetales bacterium]|nr:flagellar P-ring protein [Planctomycetales bacterium]